MSRSYKKSPIYKDYNRKNPGRKTGKQLANRNIRNSKDIPCGGAYKKMYNSYDIREWRLRKDKADLRREWSDPNSFLRKYYENFDQVLVWWEKHYRRK